MGVTETSSSDTKQYLLVKLEHGVGDTDNGNDHVTATLIFSIFVAVCGSFLCGCTMGYSSPVQSAVVVDLNLTNAEYSFFGSLLTVGGLLGALVTGKLTDYIGRRGTMKLSGLLFLTGWLLIGYSKDSWSLDFGRLAHGFANGLTVYAVPVYLAEIAPKNLRGGLVLLHQVMICNGLAFVFVVGVIISWRNLAFIATIPCTIQLLGLPLIPESPRWLIQTNRAMDFEAALQRLRGKTTDISEEAAFIKGHNEAAGSYLEDSFFSVFQKKYAYALTVSLGLMALAGFGGTFAILFYATEIFESAGFSGTIGTVAMALIQIPPAFIGVLLMDKFGRRPLLLFSAAGMGAATFSLGLSFWMNEHSWMTNSSPYLALFGVLLFSAAYPLGMAGIPFVIMSEIFPISVKGAAGSLATVVSFTSSWIVSYTFNFMMDWSSYGTFFAFMNTNLLSLHFIAKLVPETKGRTLEEIQELVTSRPIFQREEAII